YCMTLLIASLTLVYDQARNVTGTMTTLSTTAVCGAMVPVDFWPEPVQWIAQALPITHGLSAVRALEADGSSGEILVPLGAMLLAALVWLTLAFISLRAVFSRSRSGNGLLD